MLHIVERAGLLGERVESDVQVPCDQLDVAPLVYGWEVGENRGQRADRATGTCGERGGKRSDRG